METGGESHSPAGLRRALGREWASLSPGTNRGDARALSVACGGAGRQRFVFYHHLLISPSAGGRGTQ